MIAITTVYRASPKYCIAAEPALKAQRCAIQPHPVSKIQTVREYAGVGSAMHVFLTMTALMASAHLPTALAITVAALACVCSTTKTNERPTI